MSFLVLQVDIVNDIIIVYSGRPQVFQIKIRVTDIIDCGRVAD